MNTHTSDQHRRYIIIHTIHRDPPNFYRASHNGAINGDSPTDCVFLRRPDGEDKTKTSDALIPSMEAGNRNRDRIPTSQRRNEKNYPKFRKRTPALVGRRSSPAAASGDSHDGNGMRDAYLRSIASASGWASSTGHGK